MGSGFDSMTTGILVREPSVMAVGAALKVIEGPDLGAEVVLNESLARIGTAQGNELRLTDRAVSRFHCEVHAAEGGLRLIDSGSTNGTSLNGIGVRDADVVSGSIVRVGATSILVQLEDEPHSLPVSAADRFGPLLGSSLAMRRIYAMLERISGGGATVLIQGETGTGKEVVAQAIHDASPRADKPFVTIDCGAIAENLIESELFGHVRGAFSGAAGDRRGLFEEADGGTIFLDEIGELPLSMQPKLLRTLETRTVRRIGSNTPHAIDVRVLAATNRQLSASVNRGDFREDLYYRLAVVEIHLPPLRARAEDIPVLAQFFFAKFTGASGELPMDVLQSLGRRNWPGNVRELRNFVERSVSLGWPTPRIPGVAHASSKLVADLEVILAPNVPLAFVQGAMETAYVNVLMRHTGGSVTRAAELAGLNRRSLQRLMVRRSVRPAEEASQRRDNGEDESKDP